MSKLTPGKAIRATCLDCVENFQEVNDCMGDTLVTGSCQFYRYRMGKGKPSVKTIRKYCLYCMDGNWNFIRNCHTDNCPLYKYRFGKNPAMSNRKYHQVSLKSTVHGPLCHLESKIEA